MLEALRSDLSENNRGRVVEIPSILNQERTGAKVINNVELSLPAVEKKAGEKVRLKGDERSSNEEDVPVDKILSLIQVGQKAIRRVEPAVRVVP